METVKLVATSLPVPSVQELSKESTLTVPSRYHRLDLDPPSTSINTEPPSVPVIDLQKLFMKETADEELEVFHSSCKEWGFFQLVNHGISSSLLESVKLEARNIFNMSMEEKKILKQRDGLEGFGQAFVVSDEQKLDWSDLFFYISNPVFMRNPHYFEHLPPSSRKVLENYCSQLQTVAITLFRLMARALKLDEEKMEELFCDGYQSCRINYYPPCPEPETASGLSAHCDGAALALLIQADDTHGLEVAKDGKWVPIKTTSKCHSCKCWRTYCGGEQRGLL